MFSIRANVDAEGGGGRIRWRRWRCLWLRRPPVWRNGQTSLHLELDDPILAAHVGAWHLQKDRGSKKQISVARVTAAQLREEVRHKSGL